MLDDALKESEWGPVSLFRQHGGSTRRGGVIIIALASVIAGLGLVAAFITPRSVSQLNIAHLLGIAGLFVLPGATIAAWIWERRAVRWANLVALATPVAAETQAVSIDDELAAIADELILQESSLESSIDDEATQLAATIDALFEPMETRGQKSDSIEFAQSSVWIQPDLPSSRSSDGRTRHRHRTRAASADVRDA